MNKVSIKTIFFCDHFSIDQNNKPNLLGIFKNINFLKVPSKFLKLWVVIFLEYTGNGTVGSITVVPKLIDPEGNNVSIKLPQLTLPYDPKKPEGLVTLELGNIEFTSYGTYTFEIISGKEILGSEKLEIKQRISN